MGKNNLTVVGLFAGVGGIELGFEQAGFRSLISNEIDEAASRSFVVNNKHKLLTKDINDLGADELPDEFTVLTGGFPCQPFSVAGYRKGFDDHRGNVFWEIHRLINAKKPRVVFLENVKNLQGHDGGNTFKTIVSALEALGYTVTYKVLNAKDFGNVPQNRERIYIVAFRETKDAENFQFPEKIDLTNELSEFIDFENQVARDYYYSERTPFFDQLRSEVTEIGVVYQWRRKYVRANKSGVSPTLTANMGMGGHNVPIVLTKHGIRKLTPEECFKLMGFRTFKLAEGISRSQLYKQAGNSVVVPVIQRIAKQIAIAIQE